MLNRWIVSMVAVMLLTGCQKREDSPVVVQQVDTVKTKSPATSLTSWVDTFDLATIKRREFEISVDPTMTIEQMVAAGKYDYVDHGFTTANFDLHRAVAGTNRAVLQKLVVFRIGQIATLVQVRKLRQRLGLKPIGIDHQIAFGAQHKRAQQVFRWIVNVDSMVVLHGQPIVPCFRGEGVYRRLNLYSSGGEWGGRTWFFGLSE